MVLERWFPDKTQLSLWPPDPIEIQGDCIVSYEAGYEQAKREPHMKDHFHDANTVSRHERRRRGSLVEAHVKSYFNKHYREYYRPASNEGDYAQWAFDDFQLALPNWTLLIDVKSVSYEDNGQKHSPIRDPKQRIIYLFAEWRNDDTTLLYGIRSGDGVRSVSEDTGSLIHMSLNKTLPIDCLLVMLNMTRAGLDYKLFYKNLHSD